MLKYDSRPDCCKWNNVYTDPEMKVIYEPSITKNAKIFVDKYGFPVIC